MSCFLDSVGLTKLQGHILTRVYTVYQSVGILLKQSSIHEQILLRKWHYSNFKDTRNILECLNLSVFLYTNKKLLFAYAKSKMQISCVVNMQL